MNRKVIPTLVSTIKTEPEVTIKQEQDEDCSVLDDHKTLDAFDLLELKIKHESWGEVPATQTENNEIQAPVQDELTNGDVAQRMRSRFLSIVSRRPPCAASPAAAAAAAAALSAAPRVRVHIPADCSASGGAQGKKEGVPQRDPFPCGECGMAFKHEQYMRQHERACKTSALTGRADVRAWSECPQCPAVLAPAALADHLLLHADDLFRCDVCGQAFDKLCKLTNHKVRHDKRLLRFRCGDCGRAFPLLSSLRRHQRRHPPQPPIVVCPHCPKSFRYDCMLRRHLRTHAWPRVTAAGGVCQCCGEAVASLALHARTHAWRSPHRCGNCGAYFADAATLGKHRRRPGACTKRGEEESQGDDGDRGDGDGDAQNSPKRRVSTRRRKNVSL